MGFGLDYCYFYEFIMTQYGSLDATVKSTLWSSDVKMNVNLLGVTTFQ